MSDLGGMAGVSYCNRGVKILLAVLVVVFFFPLTATASEADEATGIPSWSWLVILFAFSFLLGIIAIMTGLGGGVLFVPIVSGFFPFHLDFVRGTGLVVALAGAIAASPGLLKKGLANIRLALPMALVASIFSILGAVVGLSLPTKIVQVALGATIIGIVIVMSLVKASGLSRSPKPDFLSRILGIYGIYYEESLDKNISWNVQRTPVALFLFVIIGFLAGMFGMGAGWANVPVLNLVLGAPLKVSVASSLLILTVNGTAASWVYLNRGAVLPIVSIPAVAGIMLGTQIGVRVLAKARIQILRWVVVGILLLAGARSLLRGLSLWV